MKYIKITLLLAIAASSTLHGFSPGDAASAGPSNNTSALPPCMAIESGFQYNSLTRAHAAQILTTLTAPQANQYTGEVLDHGFIPGDATSAGALGIQEPGQSQESDAKKKHACPHCSHTTNKKSNLTKHIRTHTGERPYKCDHPQCDKAFMSGSDLNRHNRAVHDDIGNSSRECSMRLPSCEQTPADSQCHNFTQLTEESQDAALLLSLARNPRNFAAPESANKRREVSEDRPPFTIPVITTYQNPVKPAQEWVHINRQSFSCPVPNCPYKTHNKENLRSHMRAKHPAPACPH